MSHTSLKKIDYIRHATDIISVYQILVSGKFMNASELNIKGTTGEDNKIIYFTPTSTEFIKYERQPSLILDFDKTINKYNSFFINNSNSYGPGKGVERYGSCDCGYTYYSPGLPTDLYNPPIDKPCYISSLEEISDIVITKNDQSDINEECDGGAEVGFYTKNIDLKNLLRYVFIPDKETLVPYTIRKIEELGVSVDEFYDTIHQKADEYDAKLVIYNKKSKLTGGYKSLSKKNKRKNNNKTKRIMKNRKFRKNNKSNKKHKSKKNNKRTYKK